jgi:hypothetical protein
MRKMIAFAASVMIAAHAAAQGGCVPVTSFDLALAANTLRGMAAKGAPLGEESLVDDDGIDFLQAHLTLERAKDKLRLTLFRGPL